MMEFSFDLISDLHVESWSSFDWSSRATSPYCIVAGDVGKDTEVVKQTLKHLGQCYQAVFYIDGNEEHKNSLMDLGKSYSQLSRAIKKVTDVVYLQSNIVILNGVAIVATNGWWCFDFDPLVDCKQSQEWYEHNFNLDTASINTIKELGHTDAVYLISTIKKLQTHADVKKIVIVTHTVPQLDLVNHDIDLADSVKINYIGNKYLQLALDEDTEQKVDTWCFGHYHGKVDKTINRVRFVNNCRGRPGRKWCQDVYHPLRIVIET